MNAPQPASVLAQPIDQRIPLGAITPSKTHMQELRQMPPTRGEIAEAFGFNVNAADQHVRAIAAKGAMQLVPGVSRGIVLPPPTSKPELRTRK